MTWQPKTERCAFLVDNLDLPEAAQFDGARWEYFQLSHLQDDSTFRTEVKSRQIAWSFLSAAEAVADGILEGRWHPDAEQMPWVRLDWTREPRDLESLVKKAVRRIYYRPHYVRVFGGEIIRSANWNLARYAWQELRRTILPG